MLKDNGIRWECFGLLKTGSNRGRLAWQVDLSQHADDKTLSDLLSLYSGLKWPVGPRIVRLSAPYLTNDCLKALVHWLIHAGVLVELVTNGQYPDWLKACGPNKPRIIAQTTGWPWDGVADELWYSPEGPILGPPYINPRCFTLLLMASGHTMDEVVSFLQESPYLWTVIA